MSSLVPFLIQCADRRCDTPSPVDDSSALVRSLAQNQLLLRDDTTRDGNCGVHAFFLSLADFADRNLAIKQISAWKALSKVKTNTAQLIKHLREVAVQWMRDNADLEVWDGMRFRDLALGMSHLQEPYDNHLKRMLCDKEWVDASVIHALACVFRVDVAIWQAHQEPHVLGQSMLSQSPAFGLLPLALNNDHHFWGVVVAGVEKRPTSDKLIEIEDWVRLPRACSDGNRSCDSEADDDDHMTLPVILDMSPDVMSSAEVDAELQLCRCLVSWAPWDAPTELVNSSLAAIRSPTTVRHCMVREQVIGDMIWEAANADKLPPRFQYNAASRYRLQKVHLSPSKKHVAKSMYTVAAEALATHSMIDLALIRTTLSQPCWKRGRIHTCMDVFRNDPQIIRAWRVMWRCLPATVRREKLIHMMAASYQTHRQCGVPGDWVYDGYSLLGQKVCREAFRMLTGIGVSSLTIARDSVMRHKQSSCARSELSQWLDIVATNKPKLYLDSRQWLEWYADTHAEKSPISLMCYLPGGRKLFYHLIYERDRRSRGLESAQLGVFLHAWRCETPWIVIPRRLGGFLKCGLCEWLKLQIDRTPRTQPELMSILKERLTTHFQFQSAQRMVQSRIQEHCYQSNGTKWFIKTDKMDEKATVVPTQWSQLSTPFFQKGERLVVAMNGSFYHGLERSQVHLRTMFEDIAHGSEMQMSTFLLNFHEAVLLEKRVPEELYIGADNTPKETKNKYGCWWCMWFLCVLQTHNVPLHSICMVFLLVGHTHDDIDRFFSRLRVAIAGRDYYTVAGLMKLIVDGLPGFNVRHSHLHTVWGWKDMEDDLDLPVIIGLRRVHTVNFFTHQGAVFVKWKHYMTSTLWSRPVLMIPQSRVPQVARWRPPVRARHFEHRARMDAWIDKFETNLAYSHDSYTKHKPELDILRQTINGELPEYVDGPDIELIISDIVRFGQATSSEILVPVALPHDAIVQLFPGGDLPETGVDALVEIPGVWQPTVADDILGPGSMVICRPTSTMSIGGTTYTVPFSLGAAIPGSDADASDCIVVAWWVPGASPSASLRPGKKAKVINLFRPWVHYDELKLGAASSASVPSMVVPRSDVLLMNVVLDADSQIPFSAFDALRTEYAIDVSALSLSLTHRGNIYRAHVLQKSSM